jgi:biopolymer transport protein ExbD
MNALIDVCLVLLIFFILTATSAVLQKMLEQPSLATEVPEGPIELTDKQVKELMVRVTLRQEMGQSVIRVEGEVVSRENLVAALRRFVGGQQKTELLLEYDDSVPHGIVVAVQDAAKGAELERIHTLAPPEELLRK